MLISPVRNTPLPSPVTAKQVDETFARTADFAHNLHDGLVQKPEETVPQARLTSIIGRGLMGEVMDSIPQTPALAEECQLAALAALSAGLLAGAADAALMLTLHELPGEAPKAAVGLPGKDDVEKAAQKVLEGLKDASRATLSGAVQAAQATGRFEIEQSGHFAGHDSKISTAAFKTCLVETFLTGYSVGALDSALETIKA